MFKEYCNCYANIFSSQISNVQMPDKTKKYATNILIYSRTNVVTIINKYEKNIHNYKHLYPANVLSSTEKSLNLKAGLR